jgi:hypothetical protein
MAGIFFFIIKTPLLLPKMQQTRCQACIHKSACPHSDKSSPEGACREIGNMSIHVDVFGANGTSIAGKFVPLLNASFAKIS